MSRAAIIGAGVAGLTAGHELGKQGWQVDVYERWPGLAGRQRRWTSATAC